MLIPHPSRIARRERSYRETPALQPGPVALLERPVDHARLDVLGPAGALVAVVGLRGVEAQAGDDDHRVPGVGVDGDPAAEAAFAPAAEPAGVERGLENPGALRPEHVADR